MNKTLRLNNLKTRTDMNAKISVFVICAEAIIYLLLYNLHDCTFNFKFKRLAISPRRGTLLERIMLTIGEEGFFSH